MLAAAAGIGSFTLSEMMETGNMQLLGTAEILLYGFAFILVLSERRQREQRGAYEKLAKELEYLNLQLKESMALSEKLASEAERRLMAGEIHDSLGHDLTGLILTLEAGKRLMGHNLEDAKDYWDKALQVSRRALNSVRELVSEKRESYFEFDLSSNLKEMASEVQALTGLKIELDMKIQYMPLSSKESYSLYRIFQEAVTNTLRHGNADTVKIIISGSRASVSFTCQDNGAGTDKIEEGNGLKGMKERMAYLGGAISFQSKRGYGFKIDGYIDRGGVGDEEDKNSHCG